MTRKNRQPVEEAFTLQFGEPDDGVPDSEEVFSSDDPDLDDQFMWRNAAALLMDGGLPPSSGEVPETIKDAVADASDALQGDTPPKTPVQVDADVPGGPAVQDPLYPIEPIADEFDEEPVVVDERFDEPVLSGPQAQPYVASEPDADELEVLDERQAAMITTPDAPGDAEQTFVAGAIAAGGASELRADPDASVFPRQQQDVPGFHEGDEQAPLFAKDAVEAPTAISPMSTGRKAPWVLYGTLAAGVAVLGVAFVGMILQLDRPQAETPVEIAATTGTPAQGNATPIADDGEVEAQMRVLRLAVGPFYDGKSRVQPYDGDPLVTYVLPTDISRSMPDAGFVPPEVRQDTVTVATQTETLGDGTAPALEQAVVTVTEDRIEIDLTDEADAEQPLIALNSAAEASTAIDPAVKVADAPELKTLDTPVIESPEAARVAQELSAAIEIAEADLRSFQSLWSGVAAPEATSFDGSAPNADADVVRAALLNLPAYDLEKASQANFLPPVATRAPLVAVRLVAANSGGATEGIALPAVIGTEQLPSRGSVPEPISAQVAPDPNLPTASIDVSRELAAALAAKAEAEERLAAALARASEPPKAVAPAVTEAPVIVQQEDVVVAAPTIEPAPPADTAAQEEQPVIAAITPEQVTLEAVAAAVPATTQETASGPKSWVQSGAWMPDLGIETVQTTLEGRPVLEVIAIKDDSVLPDWVQVGSLLVRVNGEAVGKSADMVAALTDRSRSLETGRVAGLFEIVVRKGLDPRTARIEVPVWRRVVLGDETEVAMRAKGSKWEATVVASGQTQSDGLQSGDILLRDFATKSNLRTPMALEEMFAAMADGDANRVDFAIMRAGELGSGGVSLAN